MKKSRCPFCPRKYQSKKDLHKHLKKIHDGDLSDEQIEHINRETTIGDMCNWKEEKYE